MKTKVTTVEKPKTVEVTIDTTDKTPDYQYGMETVVVTKDKRKGYSISQEVCIRCGTVLITGDEKVDGKAMCGDCRGTKFATRGEVVNPDQVKKIIDQEVRYKCRTCGKKYREPSNCCIATFSMENKVYGKWYRGFRCSRCSRTYDQEVDCCKGGRMQSGNFMPASMQLKEAMGL